MIEYSRETPQKLIARESHRLVALADEQVTFRWRDSADDNQQKLMGGLE